MQRAFLPTARTRRGEPAACCVLPAVIAAVAGPVVSGCAEVSGPRSFASVDVRVPTVVQLWIGERAVHRYPAHRSWRVGNGAQVAGTYRVVMTVFSGAPGRALTDLDATVVVSSSFTVR